MKEIPCLCDGRTDIRCETTHCDIAGPGQPGNPNQCRVCWLRLHRPSSPDKTPRSLPCLYLGKVVDKRGCACPAKWLRHCDIHKVCSLEQCKICPDYEVL